MTKRRHRVTTQRQPFPDEDTYTTPALAVMLGVSAKTVRNVACAHGELFPVRYYRRQRRFWTLGDVGVVRGLFGLRVEEDVKEKAPSR